MHRRPAAAARASRRVGALARFNNGLDVALFFFPRRHFYLWRSHAGQWFSLGGRLITLWAEIVNAVIDVWKVRTEGLVSSKLQFQM